MKMGAFLYPIKVLADTIYEIHILYPSDMMDFEFSQIIAV